MGWKDLGLIRTASELEELIAVAKGKLSADLIIRGGKLVNVNTAEIIKADIAIKKERIAVVGNLDNIRAGKETIEIDAEGKYLVPGLIDPHYHSYHAQQNMTQFARLVLPHGITAIADSLYGPGMLSKEAIRFFIQESKSTSLKLLFTVPIITYLQNIELGLPKIFDSLNIEDMIEMLNWDECFGLEEPPADAILSIGKFPEMYVLFAEALKLKKVITGHAWGFHSQELNGYIASGVSSDHECEFTKEAVERARLGMWVLMREGSSAAAIKRLVKAITEECLDSRYFSFCVDVGSAVRLNELGGIDECIRVAIACGLNPIQAIQMATINAAAALGVGSDLGSIAPGKFADILLVEDLPSFIISTVIANGNVVSKNGECLLELPQVNYPSFLYNTVRVKERIATEIFHIKTSTQKEIVEVRVIEVVDDSLFMAEGRAKLKVKEGSIQSDISQDVLKIIMFESFNSSGDCGKGFVRGFNLKKGAIASSHNSFFHGINVVGTNDYDMSVAANAIIDAGGGEVAVLDGKVIALLELPLCGVLSDSSLETTLYKSKILEKAVGELGCVLKSPFRSLAFTTAVGNIGELKICDKGLINIETQEILSPFIG